MTLTKIQKYRKEYYLKNKETIRKNSKKSYINNRAKILARHKEEHKHRDTRELLVERARSRAKRENIPFNLTKEDIILPKKCPVFGFDLKRNVGCKSGKYNSYSIDKIIPEKGYIKGNIQIISHKANCMKHNASLDDLIKFAKWIMSAEYIKWRLENENKS